MILTSDFTDIIVRLLPPPLKDILMEHGPHICIAGGFCRDAISGRDPKDADIFAVGKREMEAVIEKFGWEAANYSRHHTANTVTFKPFLNMDGYCDIQFITRVYYPFHTDLISSFDFTICQCCVYWSGDSWIGLCTPEFWEDILAERARYTAPIRTEDPGASVLRLVKFARKGYKIGEQDVASCIGRFYAQLSGKPEEEMKEKVKSCFRRVGYGWRTEAEPVEDREVEA